MGYSQVALENKLLDMYPEITKKGFAPMMGFDQEKNAWSVKLKKGKKEFIVYLNKKDADACMDGTFCENFGNEIASKLREYSA
jgi:hypothetical protein